MKAPNNTRNNSLTITNTVNHRSVIAVTSPSKTITRTLPTQSTTNPKSFPERTNKLSHSSARSTTSTSFGKDANRSVTHNPSRVSMIYYIPQSSPFNSYPRSRILNPATKVFRSPRGKYLCPTKDRIYHYSRTSHFRGIRP